jgi:hypothetical protein
MAFVIDSSGGRPLSQQAMRRLVEVVDGYRGQPQVFVVFRDSFPYQAVSVHTTLGAARESAKAEPGRSFLGPVAPRPAPTTFYAIRKKVGTTFEALPRTLATVVLLDANDAELDRFPVNFEDRLPDPDTDIEALLFTPSSIDKYAIPYLTRVFGAEYAAAQRRKWIVEEK